MKPELCIGSAQFGFNYGITNKTGKVKENEVKINPYVRGHS